MDSFHKHKNWATATAIAAYVLPGSTGLEIDLLGGVDLKDWSPFDFEEMGQSRSATVFLERFGPLLRGLLVVVSDASYRDEVGPLFVLEEDLPNLLSDYAGTYGEPFFNSDVVVISPSQGVAVLVHHNGLAAVVAGAPLAL